MDIAGYDEWRLAGPDEYYEPDHDPDTLKETAESLALQMFYDDPERVEYIIAQDDSWLGIAVFVSAGVLASDCLQKAMLDLVVAYLLEYALDEVESCIEVNQDSDQF